MLKTHASDRYRKNKTICFDYANKNQKYWKNYLTIKLFIVTNLLYILFLLL